MHLVQNVRRDPKTKRSTGRQSDAAGFLSSAKSIFLNRESFA